MPTTPVGAIVTLYDSEGNAVYPVTSSESVYMPDGTKLGFTKLRTDMDDLQTEMATVKTSVSEGKTLVAAAVTDKGVPTAATDTFQQIADNIESIASIGASTPTVNRTVYGNSISKGDIVAFAHDATISYTGVTYHTVYAGSIAVDDSHIIQIQSYSNSSSSSIVLYTINEDNTVSSGSYALTGSYCNRLQYQYIPETKCLVYAFGSSSSNYIGILDVSGGTINSIKRITSEYVGGSYNYYANGIYVDDNVVKVAYVKLNSIVIASYSYPTLAKISEVTVSGISSWDGGTPAPHGFYSVCNSTTKLYEYYSFVDNTNIGVVPTYFDNTHIYSSDAVHTYKNGNLTGTVDKKPSGFSDYGESDDFVFVTPISAVGSSSGSGDETGQSNLFLCAYHIPTGHLSRIGFYRYYMSNRPRIGAINTKTTMQFGLGNSPSYDSPGIVANITCCQVSDGYIIPGRNSSSIVSKYPYTGTNASMPEYGNYPVFGIAQASGSVGDIIPVRLIPEFI